MKKSEYILFHGDKIINCYSYQGIYYFIHFKGGAAWGYAACI